MALDLTGKLSEVFGRIGNDISDLINQIQTNTDNIAAFENKTTNLENQINDLINFPVPSIVPPTNLNGAVLISKLVDGEIIYTWESLSDVPMNAELFQQNFALYNVNNGTYDINTGALVYGGGTLPVIRDGIITNVSGATATLILPADPNEELIITTKRPTISDYIDTNYEITIILSNNSSAIDSYNDASLQSIKLTSDTSDGSNEIFKYSVRNNNNVLNGTSTNIDTVVIKGKTLLVDGMFTEPRALETTDDIKYVHCIVTNNDIFKMNETNTIKFSYVNNAGHG